MQSGDKCSGYVHIKTVGEDPPLGELDPSEWPEQYLLVEMSPEKEKSTLQRTFVDTNTHNQATISYNLADCKVVPVTEHIFEFRPQEESPFYAWISDKSDIAWLDVLNDACMLAHCPSPIQSDSKSSAAQEENTGTEEAKHTETIEEDGWTTNGNMHHYDESDETASQQQAEEQEKMDSKTADEKLDEFYFEGWDGGKNATTGRQDNRDDDEDTPATKRLYDTPEDFEESDEVQQPSEEQSGTVHVIAERLQAAANCLTTATCRATTMTLWCLPLAIIVCELYLMLLLHIPVVLLHHGIKVLFMGVEVMQPYKKHVEELVSDLMHKSGLVERLSRVLREAQQNVMHGSSYVAHKLHRTTEKQQHSEVE